MEVVTLNLDNITVGRLVSVITTPELVELLGSCAACSGIMDTDETAALDWVNQVLIHKRNGGRDGCVVLYIAKFIRTNPEVSTEEIMITFGMSLRTVMRCRKKAREDGS